jgi:hypothetical protein
MRSRDSFGGISSGCSGTGSCGATCGRGDVVLFVEVESVLDFVHGRHLEVLSMESDLLVWKCVLILNMNWSLGGGKTFVAEGWIYIEAILPQRASGTQTRNLFFVYGDMRKFEFHVTAISNCDFTLPSSQTHLLHNTPH